MSDSSNGYRLHDGTPIPRVTTIVNVLSKPGLESWKRKVGFEKSEQIMESRRELGERVHEAIKNLIEAGCSRLSCRCGVTDHKLKAYHDAVLYFLDSYVDEILAVEQSFISAELGYGGKPDLYAKLDNGSYAVIDFKTGANTYREHNLQLAGYNLLLWNNGLPVGERVIVHLHWDNENFFEVTRCEDDAGDYRAFMCCLDLYNWRNNKGFSKDIRYLPKETETV